MIPPYLLACVAGVEAGVDTVAEVLAGTDAVEVEGATASLAQPLNIKPQIKRNISATSILFIDYSLKIYSKYSV